jgi:aspartate kinase
LSVLELIPLRKLQMQNQKGLNNSEILYKVGGTSMTNMEAMHAAIEFHTNSSLESRLNYVVSAYGAGRHGQNILIEKGVTDLLLESKKTNEAGVFTEFVNGRDYRAKTQIVLKELRQINSMYANYGLNAEAADSFISNEVENALDYLNILNENNDNPITAKILARERLAAIGEIHSAFNLANTLNNQGTRAEFVNLSGFGINEDPSITVNQRIQQNIANLDGSKVKIITGYTGGTNGIMENYDRGYSEVTAALYAIECGVSILTILKEFALSSADPRIVKNVIQILQADYRFANELSMVGMEAIHPKIARMLEIAGINIGIKNILDLNNQGTLITNQNLEIKPSVQMVTGTPEVAIITLENPSMGQGTDYLFRMTKIFSGYNVLSLSTDANKISIVIESKEFNKNGIYKSLQNEFPIDDDNMLRIEEKSLIIVAGSNLNQKGLFARAAGALYNSDINIVAGSQPSNPNSMQFIVDRNEFENGIKALHYEFFEKSKVVTNSFKGTRSFSLSRAWSRNK